MTINIHNLDFEEFISKYELSTKLNKLLGHELSSQEVIETIITAFGSPVAAHSLAVIIDRRCPELESVIIKDAESSYNYAYSILKRRLKLLESAILTSPLYSYHYAKNVLKMRWALAEPVIATEARPAFLYVSEILFCKWPDAEPALKTDPYYWDKYLLKYSHIKRDLREIKSYY